LGDYDDHQHCARPKCTRFFPRDVMYTPKGEHPKTEEELNGDLYCCPHTCRELRKQEEEDDGTDIPTLRQ